MSINFSFLLRMWVLTTPRAVAFSICVGVGGCLCPISYSLILAGTASQKLINSVQSSASAADDIRALMIIEIVVTAPLFGGSVDSSVM